MEVLRLRPEAAAVAGRPGKRLSRLPRQRAVGALEAVLAAPPNLKEAQGLASLRAKVAVDGDGEAAGVELALDWLDRSVASLGPWLPDLDRYRAGVAADAAHLLPGGLP